MDCETLNMKLVETVMSDWIGESDGDYYCKFCNCSQFNCPLSESHYERCPRPDWALKNADYPQARVERAYGREFVWSDIPPVIRRLWSGEGDYLTDLGRWMVYVLEELLP